MPAEQTLIISSVPSIFAIWLKFGYMNFKKLKSVGVKYKFKKKIISIPINMLNILLVTSLIYCLNVFCNF